MIVIYHLCKLLCVCNWFLSSLRRRELLRCSWILFLLAKGGIKTWCPLQYLSTYLECVREWLHTCTHTHPHPHSRNQFSCTVSVFFRATFIKARYYLCYLLDHSQHITHTGMVWYGTLVSHCYKWIRHCILAVVLNSSLCFILFTVLKATWDPVKYSVFNLSSCRNHIYSESHTLSIQCTCSPCMVRHKALCLRSALYV